jgi:hypothetical protein
MTHSSSFGGVSSTSPLGRTVTFFFSEMMQSRHDTPPSGSFSVPFRTRLSVTIA